MFGTMLSRDTKDRLADRLEGWELVDFLQIPVEEVIDAFEDTIIQHLDDVNEFAGVKGYDEDAE